MSNAVIEALLTQIEMKRRELHKVEADLAALERTLAIFKGEEVREPITALPGPIGTDVKRQYSHLDLAAALLEEVGRPLTGDQLVALMKNRGVDVDKASLLGGVYRKIRLKQTFKLLGKGTFGLLKWAEDDDPTRTEPLLEERMQEATMREDRIPITNDSAPSDNADRALSNASVTER